MKIDQLENQNLTANLTHVLWIGGSTDAGKTTTTKLLAEHYELQVYHGCFCITPRKGALRNKPEIS